MNGSKNGQALTEYLLILCLITVVGIFLVNTLGGYLMDKITQMTCDLTNTVFVEGEKPGKGYCDNEILKEFE